MVLNSKVSKSRVTLLQGLVHLAAERAQDVGLAVCAFRAREEIATSPLRGSSQRHGSVEGT